MATKRFIVKLLAIFALFYVSLSCEDDGNLFDGSFVIDGKYLMQEVESSSTSLQIPISTSAETSQWELSYDAKWLQCSKKKISASESSVQISVNSNSEKKKRTAELTVISGAASYTITIRQYGRCDVYVEGDIKVKPTGGKASEHQPDQDIQNTYDGKFVSDGGKPYHSEWNKPAQFPVTLEYYFDGGKEIDYLVYYTRSGNGNFGELEIWTATKANPDSTDYTKQGDYDFGKQNAPSKVIFENTIKATGIKFVVKSGLNDFVSCDEMEFYKTKENKTLDEQLLTVFKDITCTELKSGITDEQIQALPAEYFIRVAEALRDNTYDEWQKDFRIRSYKPYSNIAEWAERLMTKKYSDLDNPTGISVKKGDDVVVLVGDTHGQNISLQCIWETGSEYKQTASSGDIYLLNPGVNKLTMKGEGQLFLMYNTDLTSDKAKPIKIHIPLGSGTVNGFFDLEEHKTDAKYAELLGKATHKYFCVRGEKIMFYFHRSKLSEFVPDNILSAIHLWDSIVGWEQELMGIDDVRPKQVNNHMFAISPEGSYMWASDYQIGFVYTYLDNILLKENVMAAEDNAWGPAHEMGHVHQAAINWPGCTESSNNLFSNYVIYKLGKYKSRGRGLVSVATARYVDKQAWYNMGNATHQGEDTETHMRMYWQLWNYYHRCGHKKDFWQTLFKLMRDEVRMSDAEDPGKKQLEFAKMASKAANENLTDFFDMWGFFETVDNKEIEQYGKYKYNVTAQMIKEAKEEMAKYPAPKHAFQYIEDRKKDEFPSSDKRHEEVGDVGYYTQFIGDVQKLPENISASVNGKKVTITNGEKAVAFEVREKAKNGNGKEYGKLLYFSNFTTFEIPSSVATSGAGLYAVQADGERKQLEASL